jgi:hypothetical protein
MKVYIESTIPSYLAARPGRDLLQAAHQQVTRDWWSKERSKHELFISQFVLDEVACGEPAMARRRMELISHLPVLHSTGEAVAFGESIFRARVLPESAAVDVAHIALATAYNMDILLTWNCRHIANAVIQGRLRQLAEENGLFLPLLVTPEEFMT